VLVTQLDSDGCDALEQLLDAVYVAREGASARSASKRACFEAVRTSSLKSFCASILKSAGRSNKTVSSQQINAFYKSNRSQHAGVKFLDRMYGKSVAQDGTLSARKVQILNCVMGGRLLKTVKDYETCERILAQIDPKYFQDEFSVFFDENGSIRRPQSQQFTDLLRSRADEYLNVVRSDQSLSEAEEAQRARTAGTARQTAPRVVERKSTNEIIEEETGKIEVLVQYLRDSVDENGEPRLGASSVEDFKKLQALSSSALTNALRKKANTELSLKKWHVTDAEMVSILRRRTGTDPTQLPSSATPRVRPMPERDDDCDNFDDDAFRRMFHSNGSCTQQNQPLGDISNTPRT